MPNYLYPISTMRFGGLASGIDTDSMIQDMMRIEQIKVDRIKQDKQVVEWRRDAYREITNKLRAFKDEFFDITKPSNYMLSPNTYKNYKTVVSGNENALSISTNADAMPGVYKVEVEQLAETATITGDRQFKDINLNTRLSDLEYIGNGTAEKYDFSNKGLTIRINDASIEITEDMTLRQLINEINNNKDANARLSYSSITGRFVLQSKDTGKNAKCDISIIEEDDDGNLVRQKNDNFLSFLGIVSDEIIEGKDAKIKININNERDEDGTLKYHEVESSANTFTKDGITFNLYDVTADGEITTLNITEDIDASFDKIKNFVDSYNQLIEEINTKLVEKQYNDFPPLTDEQREAMSEKDIELWEEKAMSGLLRNDSVLQKLVYDMRSALNDGVEGVNIRLSDIGITTGKWYEHGKLYIDEQKLKKALSEHPDKVIELFVKTDGSSYSPDMDAGQRIERYRNVGLIRRISDILDDNIRTTRNKNNKKGLLLERAGIAGDTTEFQNVMNDQIRELDKRIDRMTEMLIRKEESYWRQFTAMEKAIQNMSAQSAWLAQQLNMGMY